MITKHTSTYAGRKAETAAAEYLLAAGYAILCRNWRRRECEIDIVASRDGTAYLVEVKYRQSDIAGNGLEYITTAKLRRMSYAAQRWANAERWRGPFVLAAIEVSGPEYEVSAFIDTLEL